MQGEGFFTLAEFFLIRDLRMADPDGKAVCRALFKDAIANHILNRLQRLKVHFAIRRALLPDPFAAVVVESAADDAPAVDAPPPPPPPKRRRVVGAAATPAPAAAPATPASSAKPSAAASSSSSSSSASVRDTLNHLVGPSDDDDSDADDEDGGAVDGVAEADAAEGVEKDDVAKDDLKPSRCKDVVTLFNDLANEVNVNSGWVAFCLRLMMIYFVCIQSVLAMKRRVVIKCEALKNIGDFGPYGSILECLAEMIVMIRPKKVVKAKKRVAQELKETINGLYKVYEEHAKKGHKGLAGIIHAQLTGIDCIETVKRARASCLAQQKSEERPQNENPRKSFSGESRSYRGNYGRGGHRRLPEKRDATNVRCHNCFKMGHFQADCKVPRKPKQLDV